MAREQGTFPFSANFEVKKQGTFDARQYVPNFSDLLLFTSANFIPNGFPVSVAGENDPNEKGIYLCLDNQNLSNPLSWKKLSTKEESDLKVAQSDYEQAIGIIINDWKTKLSINNVDNTRDSAKEVSGPQQLALDLKADKNGSASEVFKVADAVDNSDAVNKGQFDEKINALSGSLVPQDDWDASTNTPDISGESTIGHYWIVNVSGSTNIGGITDWVTNDWVVKTATGWAKIDNSEKVISVAGKSGAITLVVDDITDFNTVITSLLSGKLDLGNYVGTAETLKTDIDSKANKNGDNTEIFKAADGVVDDDVVNKRQLNIGLQSAKTQISQDFYYDENDLLQSNEILLPYRFLSPDDTTQDIIVPFEIAQVLSIHVGNTHLDDAEYELILPSTINFRGNLEKGDFVEILYKTKIQ